MIDTIVLTLNKDQFEILDPDRFTPSARIMDAPCRQLGSSGVIRCHCNPSRKDIAQGIYRPRLTLIKRLMPGGYSQNLRVEFSAPKLLFGNNFEEVSEKNLPALGSILSSRLLETGSRVFKEIWNNSNLSSVHFSKNFIFTNYTTSSMILRALAKLNLNSRLDLNKTDYRNDGHAVRFHANSYEVVFYDKIKDLQQAAISEKRAIESDSAIQANFMQEHTLPKQLEVFRMEVRLNTRRKIKTLCQTVGQTVPLTLRELFRERLAKRFLKHFWDQIMAEAKWLVYGQMRPEELLQEIVRSNPGIRPSRALQMLGLMTAAASIGVRGLKSILGPQSTRTLARLYGALNEGTLPCPGSSYLSEVGRQLDEFKLMRILDLAEKSSGNNRCIMQGSPQ